MKRLLPLLALTLAVALPLSAAARTKHAVPANAAVPTGVSCSSGDAVVWLNTETKVFHLPGSSYYGKTKHGKYLCQSGALELGAHASKREGHAGGTMGGGTMGGGTMGSGTTGGNGTGNGGGLDGDASNGASPAPGSTGKHHHHRKHGGMPSPAASPGPM